MSGVILLTPILAFLFPAQIKSPYQKWAAEDAVYLLTSGELQTWRRLNTDEERELFIERFWLARDPTPGTPENEFKIEHYRRIAYANGRFGSRMLSGWRSDRGRVYIQFGPPEEVQAHRSPDALPYERWRYRWIDGAGADVVIHFVDPLNIGEYRVVLSPSEKEMLFGR
jgi:GWxTD domain-containing protein